MTDAKNDVDATLIVDGQALGSTMKAHKLPVCAQSFEVKAKGQTKKVSVGLKANRVTSKDISLGGGAISGGGVKGMGFVKIPAGTFSMGTPKNERGRYSDETQHRVRLTQSFYLQTTEVTQGQYQALMGKNPSEFQSEKLGYRSENNPVENISWFDAIKFANALSAKEGLPKCYSDRGKVIGGRTVYACKGYRLPTEAEWEYAARAGTKGARYGKIDDIAWYKKNSGKKTHPVAKKKPNAFGLYDMLGNVWEWCHDWYANYPSGQQTNPAGPRAGSYRVDRGGSCYGRAVAPEQGTGAKTAPARAFGNHGFRLARSAR